MDNKLLEEEMRVINNVVDKVVEKKIAKVINKLLIEVDKLEKRISNFEKGNQTIYQELNFYIPESKVIQFNEDLYLLWKIEKDIEWIDDMAHITQICINEKYGSRAHVFNFIISYIDTIYLNNKRLQKQFKHDLAIILGYNFDNLKSSKVFRNAYYNAIDNIDEL